MVQDRKKTKGGANQRWFDIARSRRDSPPLRGDWATAVVRVGWMVEASLHSTACNDAAAMSLGSKAIKGPGLKFELEVRRVWRCPQCGYERRLGGQATAVACQCAAGLFMKLVQEPIFHRPENREVNVYMTPEEIIGDDVFPDDVTETASTDPTSVDIAARDLKPSDVSQPPALLDPTETPPAAPVDAVTPAQFDHRKTSDHEADVTTEDDDFGDGVVDDIGGMTASPSSPGVTTSSPDPSSDSSPASPKATPGEQIAGSKPRRSRGRRRGRSGGGNPGDGSPSKG